MMGRRDWPSSIIVHMRRLLPAVVLAMPGGPAYAAAEYVIHISVDGLRPADMQALIDAGEAPYFERFQVEGAGTNNARVDQTKSLPFEFFGFEKLVQTLPNHTSMMTGRPIERDNGLGDDVGHGYTSNDDPLPGETVHNFLFANSYKASVFDVVHDHGLRTALFAAKGKFLLFEQSWSDAGAPDTTGPDNGTDKIDAFVVISNPVDLTSAFIAAMQADPFHYTFLHYRDPDSAGHGHDWGSPQHLDAIRDVDAALGLLFDMIDGDPTFTGRTAVILTSDHGGGGVFADAHVRYDVMLDARIPFYVWGVGVAAGKDLYELNPGVRFDPGSDVEVGITELIQPIRNGDGGNLALDLLGLGPIPGSLYNVDQTIVVTDCPADIDGSGAVGILDFLALLAAWDTPTGDIDGDGTTGITDFQVLLANWGPCP